MFSTPAEIYTDSWDYLSGLRLCDSFSLPEKLVRSTTVKLVLKKQPTIATTIKKAPKPASV